MSYKYFDRKLTIQSASVNLRRVLRTSSLLRMLQELTIAFTESEGVTRKETLDRGLLWVIAKQNFDIKRLPAYDETITLRCYALPTMHIFFPRYYEIYAGEAPDAASEASAFSGKTSAENSAPSDKAAIGEREKAAPAAGPGPIITGTTLWLLMDEKKRSMVMPEQYGICLNGGDAPADFDLPKIIALPDEKTAYEKIVTAPFSFADINGHINNAHYFDIAEDAIPLEDVKLLKPAGFEAEYEKEILPGDEIRLTYLKAADGWYFRGTFASDGKDAFRIHIKI